MRRTTIFADDGLINEMKKISREENKSVAEIVREAIRHFSAVRPKHCEALILLP